MPSSDYIPDVASVGALLRARTRDTNGAEIGTFTEQTRPTGDQARSLIRTAVSDLASAVGPDLGTPFHDAAQSAVAYRTAALIELAFFPEQVATGRSPYPQLLELYQGALAALRIAVEDVGGDVSGTPGAEGARDPEAPAYAFPTHDSTLDAALGRNYLGRYYDIPWSGGLYQ